MSMTSPFPELILTDRMNQRETDQLLTLTVENQEMDLTSCMHKSVLAPWPSQMP